MAEGLFPVHGTVTTHLDISARNQWDAFGFLVLIGC